MRSPRLPARWDGDVTIMATTSPPMPGGLQRPTAQTNVAPGANLPVLATSPAPGAGQRTRLRQLLVGLDLLAATVAWVIALWVVGSPPPSSSAIVSALAVPVLAVATALVANARRLYWGRVCSIRAVEMQRMGHVVLVVGGAAAFVGPRLGLPLSATELLAGGLLTFGLATALRGGYRSWLTTSRRRGRFQRQVVIVGANHEAHNLFELVDDHPQLGLDVIGVIGEPPVDEAQACDVPYLGPVSRTEELVRSSGASGVLIATGALDADELNRMARNLLQAGVHVHLSSGLQGFAAHRMRPQLLAHESVLYLEPLQLAPWQLVAKRAVDLTLGAVALLLSLPILAVAAVAIKLEDGGPVLFRQTRVGRNGSRFTILKLRSMVVNAEARYEELADDLAGRDGPLVKLRTDPRITRVGRILRATSVDELPQILNVLAGSMSLVGPRPNLLVEAEAIDPAYLAHKCRVRPGITGLWQVEARDDPSFKVYRRLDVFYLENWSISLDLAILLVTTQRVLGRAGRLLAGGRSRRTEATVSGDVRASLVAME